MSSDLLQIGNRVRFGEVPKSGRIIATSGTDKKCLVEFDQTYNDGTKIRMVTSWLKMEDVELIPEEKKEEVA